MHRKEATKKGIKNCTTIAPPGRVIYRVMMPLLQQSDVIPECGTVCTSIGGCRCIGEKGARVRQRHI